MFCGVEGLGFRGLGLVFCRVFIGFLWDLSLEYDLVMGFHRVSMLLCRILQGFSVEAGSKRVQT